MRRGPDHPGATGRKAAVGLGSRPAPLIPLAATMGYSVAILSYYRSLYFGMMAEPRVMPDVALMKAFVDDAFEELKRRCAAKSAPGVERDAGLESASA